LDLGCNIASWIWAWRDVEPTIEYHGFDWSEVALKIANERYGLGGPHAGQVPAVFHLGDARQLDFNEEFDIIFTHTFYQHTNLETKQMVVSRAYKALKPGGLHIIQENTTYNSEGTWLTQGWIDFFTSYGFKLERVKDFHDGGSGFIFRK
jgi:ubiquinone/menaquinone biosynthesis C-methylase UbiE